MMSELVKKAERFARRKHEGQYRQDGSPYIEHPLRVAENVRKFKKSHKIEQLTAAAILHDTLEDTETTVAELGDKFGHLVALLVLELTSDKLASRYSGKTRYLSHKMGSKKLMDSWALVIKLCDRLDNVSDLVNSSNKFAKNYKEETEEILDQVESERKLTNTHKKIISEIRNKIE